MRREAASTGDWHSYAMHLESKLGINEEEQRPPLVMGPVDEESGVHEEWYKCARAGVASVDAFIETLSSYEHDYGTICHAIAAAAIAAAIAVDHSDQGGITGSQAGAITWEFIRRWGTGPSGPARIFDYEDMLYPQFAERFESQLNPETWDYLKKKADENLKRGAAAHDVLIHWASIVAGKVPFGWSVRDASCDT